MKRILSPQIWPAFIISFLGLWANYMWLKPLEGSEMGKIMWLPSLVIAVVITLCMTLLLPKISTNEEEGTKKIVISKELGVYFWILVIILIIPIVLGYTI